MSPFALTLLEGLTDTQSHSASGSCVVLNSIVRIRGQELRKDVSFNLRVLQLAVFIRCNTEKIASLVSMIVHVMHGVLREHSHLVLNMNWGLTN